MVEGNSLELSTSRKSFSRATANHCHPKDIFHGFCSVQGEHKHTLLSAVMPPAQPACLREESRPAKATARAGIFLETLLKTHP